MMIAVLCVFLVSRVSTLIVDNTPVCPAVAKLFLKIDTNPKDGVINSAEWHVLSMGYDANGDGTITRADFVSVYKSRLGGTQDQGEAAFRRYDINHNGVFDDVEIAALFNLFDGNGDGQITPGEYQVGLVTFTGGHAPTC